MRSITNHECGGARLRAPGRARGARAREGETTRQRFWRVVEAEVGEA
ncbi:MULTISPECIES: hypothetical protein [Haloferacaceae]|uniref:Uncharacterized protein n=1 Tax=Halorubrum glutamatedens TaxID=2707018 RepID=A0ABD5QN47_9EURY|nr:MULTISPECIES: hypothetical protein [Haloferacales]